MLYHVVRLTEAQWWISAQCVVTAASKWLPESPGLAPLDYKEGFDRFKRKTIAREISWECTCKMTYVCSNRSCQVALHTR